MAWMHVLLGATVVLAGPVVAAVVAPGVITGLAESGVAVNHRHFVFDEERRLRHEGTTFTLHLADGDLYELPLTTQVVLRGSVSPAPSDEDLRAALAKGLGKLPLPILSFDLLRDGEAIELRATLPAGVMANLSPEYQDLLARYERPG